MRTLVITTSYPSKERPFEGVFVQEFAQRMKGAHFVLAPTRGALDGLSHFRLPWLGGSRALADLDLKSLVSWLIALHFIVFGCLRTLWLCWRLKIDRVAVFWTIPSGIFALAPRLLLGVRFTTHSLGSDIWRFEKSALGRLLLATVLRLSSGNYADGYSLVDTVRRISRRRAMYLPLGRALPPPNTLREQLDMKKTHFLFVGRYHPNKGPDQLIKAVAGMFKPQREAIRVYMYGVGEMEDELRAQVARAGLDGVIRIGGQIDAQHLSNALSAVDYLVVPSRVESVPMAAADAVLANCPLIAMPVGDLPWLLNHYKCGILAKEPSPEGLRIAMLHAVFKADRAAFLVGCRVAAKLFDIDESVRTWESEWNWSSPL